MNTEIIAHKKRNWNFAEMVILTILLCALAFVLTAGTGCAKTTLSSTGVYHGDVFLYNVEKTTLAAHNNFQSFLKWELQYREVLPVEVSRAADVVRVNEKRWLDSVNSLHDAYVATPTAENKDKLQLAFNLIDSALAEATKYMSKHKKIAPNAGITK